MLATSRALEIAVRDSDVTMRIACPRCGKKMLIHVGLTLPLLPDASENSHTVQCVGCGCRLIPLTPGPISDGPFAE